MSQEDTRWAVGVDVGGSALKGGLVATDGTIAAFERTPLDRTAGPDRLLDWIGGEFDRLTKVASARNITPVGIGVGCPGSIDRTRGQIHKSPNFPGWDSFPLRDRLHELTTLPIHLANDVNAAALGELKFGAGEDYETFVMVTLGTGVGGAIVVDGRLHQGIQGFAGEVGHMTVDPNGPACACGNIGCLEKMVGAPALVERARAVIKDMDGDSPLASLDAADLTPEAIGNAAQDGDPVARKVLLEMGQWLGIAFISLINLLDPECILVGGGIAQAGAPLFDAIRRTVENRTMSGSARTVPIVTATLGTRAGTAGSGALALWPELA
jgi:glucokinase